jgi:hypothetical protein
MLVDIVVRNSTTGPYCFFIQLEESTTYIVWGSYCIPLRLSPLEQNIITFLSLSLRLQPSDIDPRILCVVDFIHAFVTNSNNVTNDFTSVVVRHSIRVFLYHVTRKTWK